MAKRNSINLSEYPPSTFAARLRQIIGDEAIYAFGRRSGVSDTGLRSYLKGAVPSIDKAILIAKAANVSVQWLVTGEGSKDLEEADVRDNYVQIPFVDVAASAGTGVLVAEESVNEVIAFDRHWLRSRLSCNPTDLSIITVQGDSMSPTLMDGDMIFVDHKITELRDGIYVFQMDGDLLVKRLQKLPGSLISVISDNPKLPPFTVDMNLSEKILTLIGRYRGRISFE